MSEIQNGTEKRPLECRTYTVNEIARILGISQARAYRLVQEGLFKSVRIGNAIRIPKRSFDKCLQYVPDHVPENGCTKERVPILLS